MAGLWEAADEVAGARCQGLAEEADSLGPQVVGRAGLVEQARALELDSLDLLEGEGFLLAGDGAAQLAACDRRDGRGVFIAALEIDHLAGKHG